MVIRRRAGRAPRLPEGRAHERLHDTLDADDPLGLAVRTAAALESSPDRHWPRWLERQTRVGGNRGLPVSDLPLVENRTGRSWTTLGSADGARAHLDPAGLLTPDHGRWSVDWMIGAGDRWLRASQEAAIRQRRPDAGPVIETVLRIPSGDLVHRAFVATVAGGRPVAVIEVENQGDTPVTLALLLQPAGLLGVGTVRSAGSQGDRVLVDDVPVVALDAPAGAAAGTTGGADVGAVVAADAATRAPVAVRCRLGLAEVAVVLPLTHRTTRRIVVALDVRPDTLAAPDAVAPSANVVAGWDSLLGRAARVDLPDPALGRAVGRAVADLLVAGAAAGAAPLGRRHDWAAADAARIATECARWDLVTESVETLAALVDERDALDAEPADLLAVLAALGESWAVSGTTAPLDAALGYVGRALHRLERAGRASLSAEQRAALRDLGRGLDVVGQPDLAAATRALVDGAAERRPRGADDPDAPAVLLHDPTGELPAASALLAAAELAAGVDRGLDRLRLVVGAGGETGALPTGSDPRVGAGCRGSGHDPVATAALAGALRTLLVDDRAGDGEVRLLPVVPTDWYGQPVEVHGLRTRAGVLSFAVRWHGARPALLWEVDGEGPVRVTAPGLDPAWSSDDHRGDALLAAPAGAPSEAAGPTEGDSFA